MSKLERRQTGMGDCPALLVVNAMNAYTDPRCPLGSDMDAEMAAIGVLLGRFRAHSLPVCFTRQVYTARDQARIWREKLPAFACLEAGTDWVELDARLTTRPEDIVLTKLAPSAFYGTGLKQRLRERGVDSLFVVGFTTSGCVRASAVDSLSGDFRTLIVPAACGDRDRQAHASNLYDLEAKYADMLSMEDALAMLETHAS